MEAAAVIALHVHLEVVRIISLENMGVDVGAVEGPGKNDLPGQLDAAPEIRGVTALHRQVLHFPDARRVRPSGS